MTWLADLAALHDDHAVALSAPVRPVRAGGVVIGDGSPVVMGTVNLSRDSTYRESVAVSTDSAVRKARVQAAQGAGVVDVGAESSTRLAQRVGPADQIEALVPVVKALAEEVVVSVETYEPEVVEACLAAGARVLNMTGRAHEDRMLELAARHGAAVVLCYCEHDNVRDQARPPLDVDPLPYLIDHLGPRLESARAAGVEVLLDPGLGFFYDNQTDPLVRARHQTRVLANAFRLRVLGAPIANAMPHAFDLFEEEFRTAEGFFAVLASLGGTHLFRTHEVARVSAVLGALDALSLR